MQIDSDASLIQSFLAQSDLTNGHRFIMVMNGDAMRASVRHRKQIWQQRIKLIIAVSLGEIYNLTQLLGQSKNIIGLD